MQDRAILIDVLSKMVTSDKLIALIKTNADAVLRNSQAQIHFSGHVLRT